MKTIKPNKISNYKTLSIVPLIGLNLFCISKTTETMASPSNGILRFFSSVSSSLRGILRPSSSNSSNLHKVSKSFDKPNNNNNNNKSVFSLTLSPPSTSKKSKIKLMKYSNSSSKNPIILTNNTDTIHKPKSNKKNSYKVNENPHTTITILSQSSEIEEQRSTSPPPSPSIIIKNFEESLRRRNQEFNKIFEQTLISEKKNLQKSTEFLNDTRKEVNLKFLTRTKP